MRIRTVLIVGITVSILMVAMVAGGLYVTSRWTDIILEREADAQKIADAVFRRNLVLGDYLLNPEPRAKIQWDLAGETLKHLLDDPDLKDEKLIPLLTQIREDFEKTNKLLPRLVAMVEASRNKAAVERSEDSSRLYLEIQLLTTTRETMALAAELVHAVNAESVQRVLRVRQLRAAISGGLGFVLAGFWIVIWQRVVKPLHMMKDAIRKFGAGDLNARIDLKSDDEIGEVANAFDDTADRLKIATDALAVRSRELEAVNKELEAFCYSVSHDLRAPLRGMDAFSQALIEDHGEKLNDEARDYLTRIRKASQRMGLLIDDLLKLSRVSRGQLSREPVDLSELVRSVADGLRETASDRKVTFELAPDIKAQGDKRLLQVAFENLLGNAWKYTSKHPSATIQFGATNHNGSRAYYVRDDGAGFDMTYADNLFKPFQRLHRVDEFDGTGIGLATVQRIIHRHGGEVWAEGAVERGATIYFTL